MAHICCVVGYSLIFFCFYVILIYHEKGNYLMFSIYSKFLYIAPKKQKKCQSHTPTNVQTHTFVGPCDVYLWQQQDQYKNDNDNMLLIKIYYLPSFLFACCILRILFYFKFYIFLFFNNFFIFLLKIQFCTKNFGKMAKKQQQTQRNEKNSCYNCKQIKLYTLCLSFSLLLLLLLLYICITLSVV